MGLYADQLIAELQSTHDWPLPREVKYLKKVGKWIALRESDRDELRRLAGWDDPNRRYMVDPLPAKISEAWGPLIYGNRIKATPSDERDQGAADDLVVKGRMSSEGPRSVVTATSEGEAWWRARVNLAICPVPYVEWYSRTAVVPLFAGNSPIAAAMAFVSRLRSLGDHEVVYRLFEVQDVGSIQNVLFEGSEHELGDPVPLDEHPEAEVLEPEWPHGLPFMLAGRLVNKYGSDPKLGISDYEGVEDYFTNLDEGLTIGHENMRLVAKKRMVVPASATDEYGNLRGDQEILVAEALGIGLGEDARGSGGPFTVLEYTFDAAPLILWRQSQAAELLSRVGMTAQFLGVPTGSDSEGLITSGTALRLRLIPSVNTALDKGGFVDEEIEKQTRALQQLDVLPEDDGGAGHTWYDPDTPMGLDRGATLPEDPVERDARLATNATAGIQSLYGIVKERNPSWDDDAINEEVDRIREDAKAKSPLPFSNLGGVDELDSEVGRAA